MSTLVSPLSDAALLRDTLMRWLMSEALPTWWAFGVDRAYGGFHEKLGLRCEIRPDARRTRVLARQVFSFAVAGRMGWGGDWRRVVEEGIDYFFAKAVTPDGTVRMVIEADGSPKDDTFSLYDHAFALFAYAAAASVSDQRARIEAEAVALRDKLVADYKHPVAGFEEAAPRSLPLKANPHMHLFEASLAWIEAGGDAAWGALADEIAELCLTRLLDADGWLREFFDGDWVPVDGDKGRIAEPGHHFEWAWLLVRWGRLRNRPDAVAAARRLAALAEQHGVDPARNVAMFELYVDGSVKDGSARLWSQTERIKGHVLLAEVADDEAHRDAHLALAAAGARGLMRYLDTDTRGLWWDRLTVDDTFVVEPAPASSFYHIICAIEELDKAVVAMGGSAAAV